MEVSQLYIVRRVDIVWWHVFSPDSLKFTVRKKRTTGTQRRVQADNKITNNWQEFLRLDENKSELFHYLSQESITVVCSKDQNIVSTHDETVLNTSPRRQDISTLSPSNHQEAVLRALDATWHGHKKADETYSCSRHSFCTV